MSGTNLPTKQARRKMRKIQNELMDRLKKLAAVVDNVIFDAFPFLEERGYKRDHKDDMKPLGFQLLDQRIFKADMMAVMRETSIWRQLQPPFPGLWKCYQKQTQPTSQVSLTEKAA